MTPKRQAIIYLEKEEEITSVIDRLIDTDEKNITLVVPQNALFSQSSVNLKLLKRETETLEKLVTIVSQDEYLQRLAQRLGFRVCASLDDTTPALEERKISIAVEPSQGEDEAPAVKEKENAVAIKEEIQPQIQPEKESGLEPEKPKIDILEELIAQSKSSEKFAKISDDKIPSRKMADVVWPQQQKRGWKIPFIIRKNKVSLPKPLGPEEKLARVSETVVKAPSFSRKALAVFFVSAFLLLALVLYFVLPKAEIDIVAKKNQTTSDLAVVASRDISKVDIASSRIPAQLISIEQEKQKEFPTTGEKQLNEKARGVITVYNSYSSSPQTLVETTRFLSTDGKLFRTIKTITVPGAKIQEGKIIPSFTDVEVMADQPGPDYNIGPSDFTIPGFKGTAKYSGFYGKSKTAMTQGATGKVKIVTKEDLDKAEELLRQEVFQDSKGKLYEQIPSDLKLLDSCFKQELSEIVFSRKAGDEGEKFTLEIKVNARALLFSEAEMKELAYKNILSKAPQNQEVKLDSLRLNYLSAEPNFDKWQISFLVEAVAVTSEKVNTEEIKKQIVGKNEIEVRRIFGQIPEIESVKVVLWPFWVKKIPSHPSRLQIRVE